MMKYIKAKGMRDVAARVHNWRLDFVRNEYSIDVTWMNLLGTYSHPEPFYMPGPKNGLASETITISLNDFDKNWMETDNVLDFRPTKSCT